MTADVLSMHNQYNMLSVPDLLLAREKNHIELMRRQNVVGTAVGYYLIRRNEPTPGDRQPGKQGARGERTLANSEVRDYSWPCILVFVDTWQEKSAMDFSDIIPQSLYLDDGRKVPVCVVKAPLSERAEFPIRPVVYPASKIGGGFPVIANVQGREHVASIGCLVRDGHTVYALTNRHVTGDEGEPVYARLASETVRIGSSAKKQLTRVPFTTMYPDWAGKQTFLNLDIGLIRIDDLNGWTSDIYGIGNIGQIADLGIDNLTLRLIDCPVRAYGCGSGQMRGAIKALFYRYKSLGGFEYVSDFLIGPRSEKEELATHPGDSGTVWLLEQGKEMRPIAVQWGGQVFLGDGVSKQSSYALATCLSTVCNLLELEPIRDWNLGAAEYWGEVGHFTIGALACTVGFKGLPKLAQFMSANIEQIGFKLADLKDKDRVLGNKNTSPFTPLADVADDVWRNIRRGAGADHEVNNDANNHFADMDQEALSGPFQGKTLLQITTNPANIDPKVWFDFYSTIPDTNPGALPFRVWQGYELMVKALQQGDLAEFLNVAGCVSHYVGDACQPLHISRLHHNDETHQNATGKKVHSIYETDMLNANAPEIVDGIAAALQSNPVTGSFKGGQGAAARVIALMRKTVHVLPPASICAEYNKGTSPSDRLNRLWTKFGSKTIQLMAEGCICMADIWASAWKEGKGEALDKGGAIDQGKLTARYRQSAFFPSTSLRLMIPVLTGQPAPEVSRGASQEMAAGHGG
jgi:hypothetical protein